MQAHAAGRLDEAAALYTTALQLRADDVDALHLLGVLNAQRGQHDSAVELISRAIVLRPAEAMFHNNLGNVLSECGRPEQAEAAYMRALQLDGERLDALNNLGLLLGARGDVAGAERLLRHVVSVAPAFMDARQNLVNLYMRSGRVGEALQQCLDGLVVAPRHPGLARLLGVAYSLEGRQAEAAQVWRAWLQAEPGNPLAQHHLSACTGEAVPARASDDYVSAVFDGFAGSFDAKLAQLHYRAPELVAQAVQRHAAPPQRALQVLDAGCGTGLCAPLLAPWAQRLVGVDLSAGMLAQAAARGGYDELLRGELVACLQAQPAAWDLVVSADTLCYFGALHGFAAAVAVALRPGGLLVFTVEAHGADGDNESGQDVLPDHRLQPSGRYSHRRRYVQDVLQAAGLQLLELQPEVLRDEAHQPVKGWLVAARAGA